MKLFGIKNISTNKLVPGLFFESKQKAKVERDKMNQEEPSVYVVSPGPDHHKYKA